jgi:hypothetical protein
MVHGIDDLFAADDQIGEVVGDHGGGPVLPNDLEVAGGNGFTDEGAL